MELFNNIYVIVMLLITFTSYVRGENCDVHGVLLYEDIGCEPIKSEGENCPNRYECDFTRPRSGCTFKGKNYSPAEDIPANLTYSGCSIGCRCEDFDFIRCAVLDCPEHLTMVHPGCYNEYELGKCCASGHICNATDADSKKCKVDGKTYELGEKFYPKNTCFTCVCHENFTGEFDEETCIRQNCVAQVRFTEEINKKCAPAYFNFHSEEVLCCPDDFICPEDADDIKTVNREVDLNSTLECNYGEEGKLKLGEGFSRKINKYGKDRNLSCECVMPPLVTCKEV